MPIKLTVVKPARRLTWTGWLLAILIFVILSWGWAVTAYDFLAVNKPVKADIWVIEEYVPDFVLDNVAEACKTNPSLLIVCVGWSISEREMCTAYNNYADFNAAYIRASGVDSLQVISAPAGIPVGERTYTMALAAKKKLKTLGYKSGELNVVSHETKARSTLLLYRKAFKPDWKVGVMIYPDSEYTRQWWKNSEGARAVVSEMLAYLYCAVFFHP